MSNVENNIYTESSESESLISNSLSSQSTDSDYYAESNTRNRKLYILRK